MWERAMNVELSNELLSKMRELGLIHDWADDGMVCPFFAEQESDWTHIEEILWYILWLKETADDKEVWYDDNCPI
jgi:hypothetical protein